MSASGELMVRAEGVDSTESVAGQIHSPRSAGSMSMKTRREGFGTRAAIVASSSAICSRRAFA